MIIVREGPDKDKHISKDELRYIQDSLDTNSNTIIKHPWKEIFTSKPVYAISASHFAENWGFYTMLTQLPTFLNGNSMHMRDLIQNELKFSIGKIKYKFEKKSFNKLVCCVL